MRYVNFPLGRRASRPLTSWLIGLMCLLSACATKEPTVAERLNSASQQHQQSLESSGLVEPKTSSPEISTTAHASVSQISHGDNSPEWVQRTPSDPEFYYSVSFMDCPDNPNACREKAETSGRDALRKSISVEVQSSSRSVERGLTDQDNQTFQKEYEAVIRERGRKMELEDVSFNHFYHKPTRQLQTLTRMPKQDRLERELKQWLEQHAAALPTSLNIGPFTVRGERLESLLSFYTGEFLYQRLSAGATGESSFRIRPSQLGESLEDYWKRMDKSDGETLFGEYLPLEDQLKLSFSLKKPDQEPRFLGGLEIRSSSLSRQLLHTTRASVTTVAKARQQWQNGRIILVRDTHDAISGVNQAFALFGSEVAEIVRKAGLPPVAPLEELQDIQGNALREKIIKTFVQQPETLTVTLALSGRMSPHQGFMYQGLTTVYLKVSVYRPDGSLLWGGQYEAKRFMTEDPSELSDSALAENYWKTTEKGLTEYRETLAAQFINLIAP
ncbi:MAG: hypothetical protein HQM12_22030 [SAR324 cluster bacterium]|nr:hypothetical protein [SAR324 cluster bacterium]